MIKLELDWAAEHEPEQGAISNPGDDVLVWVEYDEASGSVAVYAGTNPGIPAYRASMEVDGWLEHVYGMENEDERQYVLDAASDV